MSNKKLIVGLGNPGTEYDNTRHNIGFSILDAFGEKYKIDGKQDNDLLSWYGKDIITLSDGKAYDVVLVWPTIYMNHSGEAVQKVTHWFKVESKDLIVVHDEVALNLGKIRIGFNNGSAGHHGIESIIQCLGGNQEFIRIRVGVGPDPGGDRRKDYVLQKFSKNESNLVQRVVDVSIQAIETLITSSVDFAMNTFNGIEIT